MEQAIESILPGSLVTGAWLQEHLDDPRLRIVDIRGYVKTTDLGNGRQDAIYVGAPDEYASSHIPGSVFVDWTKDIVDLGNPVPAQIAPPAVFAAAMSERGIGNATDVVVVDHAGGHFATRLWWALRYHGHDRVALLDGGYERWNAEGRPLTNVPTTPAAVTFTPSVQEGLRAEWDDVLARTQDHRAQILDARDPAQYSGGMVRGSRGGHIPTAISVPAKEMFQANGCWKSPEEIRAVLADAGVKEGTQVIAYCNGGVTATAVLFALERAGFKPGANYDGSWNEWGERHDLAVEGWRPGEPV